MDAAPVPGTTGWRGSRPHILLTIALPTLLGGNNHPCHLAGYGPLPAHAGRELARDAVLRRILTDPITGAVIGVDGHTYDTRDIDWTDQLRWPRDDDGPGDRDSDDDPGSDPDGGGTDGGGTGGGPGVEQPGPCPADRGGAGRYRPPTALDRLTRARYPRCTVPGCRQPSWRCDLDHILRYPDGPTCGCNSPASRWCPQHPLCRHHHRMKHETPTRVHRLPDGTIEWTTRTGHHDEPPAADPAPRLHGLGPPPF